MKFDDGIPCREPSQSECDSPYVAALRPLAAFAFVSGMNYGMRPCQMCGQDMVAYSRRKVCCDCYPAYFKASQNESRNRRRAAKRMEAKK